eukprot:158912-Chlamydomonas_euryale.AAC.1
MCTLAPAPVQRFRSGAATVLVASDAMTRGMDVENVGCVVNYDAPVYAKTYVHRAGRTARAGRAGAVYSLLRPEDVRHFKAMLRKADNTFVCDHALRDGLLAAAAPRLAAALVQVQELLAAEAQQDCAAQQGDRTAQQGERAHGGGGGGGRGASSGGPGRDVGARRSSGGPGRGGGGGGGIDVKRLAAEPAGHERPSKLPARPVVA